MEKLKSTVFWGLAWINIALLVGWALKLTSPPAQAQFRSPSNYIMIPGAIQSANGSVIYVVDTTHGWMGAIYYSDSNPAHRFQLMTPVDLNQTFQKFAQQVGNAPAAPGYGR